MKVLYLGKMIIEGDLVYYDGILNFDTAYRDVERFILRRPALLDYMGSEQLEFFTAQGNLIFIPLLEAETSPIVTMRKSWERKR